MTGEVGLLGKGSAVVCRVKRSSEQKDVVKTR